jgi:putative hydrolase of the HAD superfamily
MLHEQGIKVAVLTNHRKKAIKVLKDGGVNDSLYYVWTLESFDEGKPHRITFQVCANLIDCKPKQILFVGDRPDKEIIPAREIGMRTLQFTKQGPFSNQKITNLRKKPDLTMSGMDELFNSLIEN